MEKQMFNAFLREDFKSFVLKVFKYISDGSKYLDNWHVDVICNELMDMLDGKNNRLIVNIPPRYMKSIICSVALPAFILGHDPKARIICVSYNDELAEKFASDCRKVMLSDWYQDLFPTTHLSQSRRAVNDFETTRGGGRMSTSIGGTLTGRGADWIIIDDPLKPMDAMSDIQRNKVNDWYSSTLYSRLNDKNTGKILLIMQRLHQDDLTGYLLESDANFKLIKLPVIAQEDEKWITKDRLHGIEMTVTRTKGELLHPQRENMETITGLKNTLGEYGFAGQYQQEPVPLEGGIVKEAWLHYYDINSIKNCDPNRIFLSWDTASKIGENNAYSACCVIARIKESDTYRFYLLGVYRGKWEMPDLVQQAKTIYNVWRFKGEIRYPVQMLIEDASSGTQLIQILNQERDNQGYLFEIKSIKPETDKNSRLYGASVYIQRGELLFPRNECDAWWPDFKKELLSFPGSKYKDQVDALSQCMNFISSETWW